MNEKLSGFRAPGQNSTVGGDHMEAIFRIINTLQMELADGQLQTGCHDAIDNMKEKLAGSPLAR